MNTEPNQTHKMKQPKVLRTTTKVVASPAVVAALQTALRQYGSTGLIARVKCSASPMLSVLVGNAVSTKSLSDLKDGLIRLELLNEAEEDPHNHVNF